MSDHNDFAKMLQAVADYANDITSVIGVEAVNFSKERFRAQNWIDNTTEPWPKRKTPRKSTRRERGAILVSSGRLKRSIRIRTRTREFVIVGSDVPYAAAHNDGFRGKVEQNVRSYTRALTKFGVVRGKEGKRSSRIDYGRVKTGETTVKAHKRVIFQKIPRRRFLGPSSQLSRQIERRTAADLLHIARSNLNS